MPFDVTLTITGLQEAQAMNNRAIAALQPSGALGQAVQEATVAAHRWALIYTHVDTGALKSSHRMEVGGLHGRVYIGEGHNPRSGRATAVYGPYEHERGGSHAFYGRVVSEQGQAITERAAGLVAVAVG
jgi:hypothetical protein